MKAPDPFFWQNFKQHPKEVQDILLKEFNENLQGMTAKAQANEFVGAPGWVILEFLPSLDWDVQVMVWKESLPVRDRPYALKLLKQAAKIKLGFEKPPRKNKIVLA